MRPLCSHVKANDRCNGVQQTMNGAKRNVVDQVITDGCQTIPGAPDHHVGDMPEGLGFKQDGVFLLPSCLDALAKSLLLENLLVSQSITLCSTRLRA